ncbi:DUF2397 family protein [Streptomyces sp. NPDC012616]|uniref:DUF2397 family protein n=1 Tax=Streptomyces sp. NPDC012616 TaxID=3364840 RepID=UPI0036E73791
MENNWWRALQPDLFEVFADTDNERRLLSAAVLDVLLQASSRGPMWNLSDIRELLAEAGYQEPASHEDLMDVLDRLKSCGYVAPLLDPKTPVTSLRDGTRRREAWALTRQGRVLVASVRDAVRRLSRSLHLPPRLLDAVAQTLQDLLDQYRNDADMLAPTWGRVRTHLEQLQEAGGDFYSAVASLSRGNVADDAAFSDSRRHILVALQHFARRTDQSLTRVRKAFQELAEAGEGAVARKALHGAGILEPAQGETWVSDRQRELADLQAWFAPEGSIEHLVGAATDAVHALLGAIDRRYYATVRGSDVAADFHQLARMLHAQPSEASAYRIFAAACGIWPARHPVTAAAEDITPHVPSHAGSRLLLCVRLRAHQGGRRAAGAPSKVCDVSADRHQAQADQSREMARSAAIVQALITPHPVGLSHFSGLDRDHMTVLVDLLEEALGDIDERTGQGSAVTLGAELTLRFSPTNPLVRLVFEEGDLVTPDLIIHIRSTLSEQKKAA